jgi:hypothetical protein
LRNEKHYTIAYQFNRSDPGKISRGYLSPAGVLFDAKALEEIKFSDQQLLAEYFYGIKPPPVIPDHIKDPLFGSNARKKWWQKIDGGTCGCLVIVIVTFVALYQCHAHP